MARCGGYNIIVLMFHVFFFRFHNDSFEKVPIFLFGDFNFRLNTQAVVKVNDRLLEY